ncbi:16S rRNA (cytosine(1402)-N(4))-methyltransferase RsmH [Aristophania vespae]|uniref:Ribosomal RNA small subunit methyltransferase H n=1 Tax=Aristophania vespae TaxID=2697033 RepID=A0A6P1NLJ5_9PROT|nr:16S rRNA (cytosine(1402)-N(4))-methyltransferase RsmH [Aristophania vespae]QHI95741.1 16S rRNA (cytosine(1402)-N(4))-methyltransferase RsmH [Aristophania vespae]
MHNGHYPVMLSEVIKSLHIKKNGRYLDGTFGGGGYSRAILSAEDNIVHAIDRDPDAIERGHKLAEEFSQRLHLHQSTFGDMYTLFKNESPFDGIVLDLGVSSFQLDQAERGFSFRFDGKLDMRMSAKGPSAADIVNTESEENIADILYHYGEEKRSRHIARAIIQARAQSPITTTFALADIIRSCVPRERHNFDPATRSFQALRIAVNDELGELERALISAPQLLAPGGIFVVVTFHSLEDRLVKRAMAQLSGKTAHKSRYLPVELDAAKENPFSLLYSKPLNPSEEELKQNTRSRSARLRALYRHDNAGAQV